MAPYTYYPPETVTITAKDLPGILGARKFESEVRMRTSVPGVAT